MTDVPTDESAEDTRTVAVGVLLGREPGRTGDWLADAAAFDAAGADALWVDPGPEPELDVLALSAALAVVTYRSRLVLAQPHSGAPAAELARTLGTISRLSHGRLALVADADPDSDSDRHAELAALAPGVAVYRRLPGEPALFAGLDEGGATERWASVPAPQGRAAWRAARADAAAQGVRGLVVPADPLLLDILRNPDDPGGRRDLHLAQG